MVDERIVDEVMIGEFVGGRELDKQDKESTCWERDMEGSWTDVISGLGEGLLAFSSLMTLALRWEISERRVGIKVIEALTQWGQIKGKEQVSTLLCYFEVSFKK